MISNIPIVKPLKWNISKEGYLFSYPIEINECKPFMYVIRQEASSFSTEIQYNFVNGKPESTVNLLNGKTAGYTLSDAQKSCDKHWSEIVYDCLDLSSKAGVRCIE